MSKLKYVSSACLLIKESKESRTQFSTNGLSFKEDRKSIGKEIGGRLEEQRVVRTREIRSKEEKRPGKWSCMEAAMCKHAAA